MKQASWNETFQTGFLRLTASLSRRQSDWDDVAYRGSASGGFDKWRIEGRLLGRGRDKLEDGVSNSGNFTLFCTLVVHISHWILGESSQESSAE